MTSPLTQGEERVVLVAELVRTEQPSDALVDAGCDGTRCYAVALARRPGMDAMVPGYARVIRY